MCMKKLLFILLLSPLIFSASSAKTDKYLWLEETSILTFGTFRCNDYLEKEKNMSYFEYIENTRMTCSYSFEDDQIVLTANIDDLRGLYDSWTEEGFITEVYKTGEMSLDKVNEGCQKVMRDFDTFEYTMHKIQSFNVLTRLFVNTGIMKGDLDVDDMLEHISSLFKVSIRLNTTSAGNGGKGYTCELSARDKKYGFGDDYNFALIKEDLASYYERRGW